MEGLVIPVFDDLEGPSMFPILAVMVDTGSLAEQYVKFFPNGLLLWSRHFTMSLLQSQLDYAEYPDDSQQLILRFISYSYTPTFVMQQFSDPCVSLFPSFDNSLEFSQNPLWKYEGASCEINNIGGTIVGVGKSQGVIFINIKRISYGIVSRLALPIFLLCLLCKSLFSK